MPTKTKALTRARVAALCSEITQTRVRAVARGQNEHSIEGRLWCVIGLENAIACLVGDLAGVEAMHLVHEALARDIDPAEVLSFKTAEAARQQAYLDQAAAAAPVTRAAA